MNEVQRSAVQCSAVQCSAVQCSAVQCGMGGWDEVWRVGWDEEGKGALIIQQVGFKLSQNTKV